MMRMDLLEMSYRKPTYMSSGIKIMYDLKEVILRKSSLLNSCEEHPIIYVQQAIQQARSQIQRKKIDSV